MAHPYASQAKASQKRRLSKLGAKAGKSFGSSSMYKASSYPSKGAGSSTPLTISGGTAKKRADRPSNHFASGGFVGKGDGFGTGTAKKKSGGGRKKGHSTTNIVIASPGGGAQPPQAVPVPRPVPVPVPVGGAGGPPIVPRPAGAPPGAGGPPINVNVPPPAAAGPVGPPPVPARPPGMASGGLIGSTYHNWGKGFKDGGHVKKKANGGGLGPGGMAGPGLLPARKPFAPGAVPGTPAARPGSPGRGSPVVPLTGGRPTRPGYKDGGTAHEDEAQDKKLIASMIKKSKKADGGRVSYHEDGDEVETPQASSTSSPAPGATSGGSGVDMKKVMGALGGVTKALGGSGTPSGSGGVGAANAAADAAKATMNATAQANAPKQIQYGGFKPGAIPGGSKKFNFNKGGKVKAAPSSGLGRLQRIPAAKKVPDKTEV